jgi:hypothetical protein
MKQLRLFLPAVLVMLLAACTSTKEKKDRAFNKARNNIDTVIAGEWVAPKDANLYLLFKPEEDQDHSGRFGGIAEYDRYRVTSKLQTGGKVEIELLSSASDAETLTQKIEVTFGQNFRTLTVTIPSIIPGRAPTRTLYEKVRD